MYTPILCNCSNKGYTPINNHLFELLICSPTKNIMQSLKYAIGICCVSVQVIIRVNEGFGIFI